MKQELISALPVLQSWMTEGGVRVVYIARRSLPIVDINIDFEAGSGCDPKGKAGLSEMVASLLLTGQKRYGAIPAMREEAAEHAFDEIGAKIAADAQADRLSVGLRSLSQPVLLDRAIDLLTAMLVAPSWAVRPFERERERLLAFSEEQQSDPEQLCNLRLTQGLYKGHPFGVVAVPKTICTIERRDAEWFRQQYLVRSRCLITLVGDLSLEQAKTLVERLSAALPAGPIQPTQVSTCSTGSTSGVAVPSLASLKAKEQWIDHPASQAHIGIGTLVPGVADPDYFALMLANRMFSWRLSEVVREKLGLAYEVSSALFTSRLGEHRVGLKTRGDQATRALEAVRETLATFVAGPMDADEFSRTRSELIDGRPLAMDSNAKLVRQAADIVFDGLPLDYFATWVGRLNEVTPERALTVFESWINPARQTTIVVGGKR